MVVEEIQDADWLGIAMNDVVDEGRTKGNSKVGRKIEGVTTERSARSNKSHHIACLANPRHAPCSVPAFVPGLFWGLCALRVLGIPD